MRKDTKDLLPPTTAPHVKLHCIYSTNVSTISSLRYFDEAQFPLHPVEVKDDLGDGTVGLRSLELCNSYSKYQSEPVISYQVNNPNVTHMGILSHMDTFKYIGNVIAKEAHIRTSKDIGNKKLGLSLTSYIPENVNMDVNPISLNDYFSNYIKDVEQKGDMFIAEQMRDSIIWELEKEHHRN